MLYHSSVINGHLAVMEQSGFPKIDTFIQPDEKERRYLIETLKVDEHTLNSAQDPHETPRIEFGKDHVAIILKYPQTCSEKGKLYYSVNSIGIFIFSPGYIVLVFNEILSPDRLSGSRDGAVECLNTSIDLFLRLLSQTVRRFEIQLKRIGRRKDELKKTIRQPQKRENLMDIFNLREELIYCIDALRGNGYLMERIVSAAQKIGFSQENLETLKDYAIENQQFLEQAQLYSQVLADLMDTCTSIIGNHLNFIMKNMNSLVLAISIPTFFTGLGGMSEFSWITSPYLKWYIAYPLFFGIMALFSFLIYCLLQRFYRS